MAWLIYAANAVVTAMVAVSFGSYASSTFADGNDGVGQGVRRGRRRRHDRCSTWSARRPSPGSRRSSSSSCIGILSLFAVTTLANLDPDLLAPSGYPPLKDIVSSVALTFFAFLGFGVITFTAKDLARPRPPAAREPCTSRWASPRPSTSLVSLGRVRHAHASTRSSTRAARRSPSPPSRSSAEPATG